MPEETEAGSGRKFALVDNPTTPYEVEMFDSMQKASAILEPIYCTLCTRGFIESEAKSRGLLLAFGQLLGAHLIQHCSNMQLEKDRVEKHEVETIAKNLQLLIDQHYDIALLTAIEAEAKENTKQ